MRLDRPDGRCSRCWRWPSRGRSRSSSTACSATRRRPAWITGDLRRRHRRADRARGASATLLLTAAPRRAHRAQRVPHDHGRPADGPRLPQRHVPARPAAVAGLPRRRAHRRPDVPDQQPGGGVGQIVVGLPGARPERPDGRRHGATSSFAIDPLLALLAPRRSSRSSSTRRPSTPTGSSRASTACAAWRAMNLAIVHEAMAMLRVVLAFGREKREYKRFREQGEETVDARDRPDRAPDRVQARGPAHHRGRHGRGARRRRLPGGQRARSPPASCSWSSPTSRRSTRRSRS